MPGEEFVKIAELAEIPEGKMKAVRIGTRQVMIARIEDKLYAMDNACTHVGGPLASGVLEGHVVTCPWHGSRFDVRTGEVVRGPAAKPEKIHEVKVLGNDVLIKILA
ncbi:MAG: non-heme iron oxygenase ferredoxin subunit [Nitrososphaerota archaeon]|jgi:3-phenylpropionate/trans-cinnamate dioxygenase ferredoxin subunit|nr:non-heme iron oxygenase ferredoxin subunit [Nitrososphaerota archaeon]MDG6945836.1 non-heme iron oxygenase ferredoxin subunit [Nitrososphaerota archaeon]MDG6947579.1 non-heme iron oxygenase ferredoxin subunit [Nitrososphaerota archaeon]